MEIRQCTGNATTSQSAGKNLQSVCQNTVWGEEGMRGAWGVREEARCTGGPGWGALSPTGCAVGGGRRPRKLLGERAGQLRRPARQPPLLWLQEATFHYFLNEQFIPIMLSVLHNPNLTTSPKPRPSFILLHFCLNSGLVRRDTFHTKMIKYPLKSNLFLYLPLQIIGTLLVAVEDVLSVLTLLMAIPCSGNSWATILRWISNT